MEATGVGPATPPFVNGVLVARLNSHLVVKQKMDFTFYKNENHLVEATGVEPATLQNEIRDALVLIPKSIFQYIFVISLP